MSYKAHDSNKNFAKQWEDQGLLTQLHRGWGRKYRIEIPKPILNQIPLLTGRSACVLTWYLFTEPYPSDTQMASLPKALQGHKSLCSSLSCEDVLRRLKETVGFRIWGVNILVLKEYWTLWTFCCLSVFFFFFPFVREIFLLFYSPSSTAH
jgi:hypothetical protein